MILLGKLEQIFADLWRRLSPMPFSPQSCFLSRSATGSPPVPTVVPALALLGAHLIWGQLAPQFYTHTWVQISLQRLPGFYLNSLAPVKSSRLNTVQTSRLLPGFKNLLKDFISNSGVLLSWVSPINTTSTYITASILPTVDKYTGSHSCELDSVSDKPVFPDLPVCPPLTVHSK